MNSLRIVGCSLVLGICLLFASAPGWASTFSDNMQIFVNGTFYTDFPAYDANPTNPECAPGCNYVLNVLGNPAMVGHATVLTEPGGSVSDVFGVVDYSSEGVNAPYGCDYTSPGACDLLSYSSDPSPNTSSFGDGTNFIIFPEGAGVFDATSYLNPGLIANLWTAQFSSDPGPDSEPSPTPEPGSLILLGTGLLGTAGVVRRKLNS